MNRIAAIRTTLRTSAATWGGAAWMVLSQFGVPAAPVAGRDDRVVRVHEATRLMSERETLPDGRILTLPADQAGDQKHQGSDGACSFNANLN